MSSVNDSLATAVLSPDGMFVLGTKRKSEVGINQFHVSLAHAHLGVLKATAQQHRIRLVDKFTPCLGCLQVKGIRAATPHYTTARARGQIELIHIDTAGPYQESLGCSQYLIMFVDDASRLQRPYRARDKSSPAILAVVKRFVGDMGVSRAFRANNGSQFTNRPYTEYCDGLEIRRELTAPYTLKQNGSVESALAKIMKAAMAARLEVSKTFQDVHPERVKGVRDRVKGETITRVLLWAIEIFNFSKPSVNVGMLSLYKAFYGRRPPIPSLPSF